MAPQHLLSFALNRELEASNPTKHRLLKAYAGATDCVLFPLFIIIDSAVSDQVR